MYGYHGGDVSHEGCGCGHHVREMPYSGCGCGHHGHLMTVEEEIQYLEQVKTRLDEKLAAVNTKLEKLKK